MLMVLKTRTVEINDSTPNGCFQVARRSPPGRVLPTADGPEDQAVYANRMRQRPANNCLSAVVQNGLLNNRFFLAKIH